MIILSQRLRLTSYASAAVFSLLAIPKVAAQDRSDPAAAIISELGAGRFRDASAAIDQALTKSPKNVRFWALKGYAQAHLGNQRTALAAYEHALRISPDYLPALEGAAEIEFKTSDERATTTIRKILEIRPGDQTSHAMLASLAFQRGECNEAVSEFAYSRSLIDTQITALEQYGSCLVKLRRADDAIPVFKRLAETETDKAKARYNLAVVQSLAGRYQDVISTLSPLTVANAHDSEVLDLLAEAYEGIADTPHAVAALRDAIVANPDVPKYYVDFANTCLSHGSFQVGIDMLNAGLTRLPGQAELYLVRGILYIQMAQYDRAEADFAHAERINPNVQFGSAAQGLLELQRNNLDEAEEALKKRLRTKPNDAFLHYLLAETLQKKGATPGTPQFQEAIAAAKKAVALQPSLTLARDVLSRLLLRENRIDEAIEQCRRAYEDDPTDQTALYHYIVALRRRNPDQDVSQLTKKLAQILAQARAKDAAEHKYALVEVKPAERSGSSAKP
jgi:tetratricopeptide (TPR) repeat protein